ncbi:MAG: ABC transporter permease [Gemmataceae bacterium]
MNALARATETSTTVTPLPGAVQPSAKPVAGPVSESEPLLTVIEPRGMWNFADVLELIRYRDLFYYLTLRDIKLRYKQTILGVGWSLFQPLATMAVFALFIGNIAGLDKDIPNYSLFAFCAVLPWTFFSNSMINAGNSLLANERLVTKAYFPRVLMPMANVGAALFDFCVCMVLLAGLLVWYRVEPTWQLLLAPVAIGLIVVASTGVGVLLSALVVAQRDFKYLLSFGTQVWMFATPCIYLSPDKLGPRGHLLLPLNPAYGLIANFRACLLGTPIDWYSFIVSGTIAVLLLFIGLTYFRRVERSFADVI